MALFTWEVQDGVAKILLNNPANNTLTIELMEGLSAVVRNMAAAPAGVRPRVIILGSAVRGQFSQGIDPAAVVKGDLAYRKKIFLTLGDLVESLWFSYIPVIADVNGPAIAGGAVLAMLADFILMDTSASKICFSEVKVGLPVPGFVQRLVQVKTSPANWTELILLGKNINATDAQRMGIANGTYRDDEERQTHLNQYVSKILRLSPAVLAETLRQTRMGEQKHLEMFRADIGSFAQFLADEFCGNALKAVMAGESPRF
jgi:enoyl-CoA hydratase/carnithine racemase